MVARFQMAAGSIPGRTHVLGGRNNQDAWAWRASDGLAVGVVADGCSSGSFSEVGARIGAELFASRTHDAMSREPVDPERAIASAADEVTGELRRLATVLGGALPARVESTLLFTVVGVVLTPAGGAFFSVGDGVTAVDRQVRTLGPFANNAPPYLAYRLLGADIPVKVERFALTGRSEVLIGTDGAGDVPELGALCADDKVFANADMLRRRLTVLSRSSGRLLDDTTVLAVRCLPGAEA